MAEVEYGGIKVGGSKALLIIPLLGTIIGGLWGGFEVYQRYLDMEAKIASYTAPDLTGIEQELAVIQETLISVSESVELARDYTRTIKNDLKDDIARQETLMERLEDKVNSSQDEIDTTIDTAEERFDARRDALYSDTDRKIKELEERLNARLQRALDNPLANQENNMPKVGGKKFAYTAKGKAKAKSYAKKTGKSVRPHMKKK